MRISRQKAQENHDRVVAAASELFRARGFDGVAVAEIMQAAGLTHGGFYNHFASKEALAAEALRHAFAQMTAERARVGAFQELAPRYLSKAARDHPGKACPAAALGGDAARQPPAVREAFAEGLEGMIADFEADLGAEDPAERRRLAIGRLNQMVGALMLSRAAPEPLSSEILATALSACRG